MSANRAFEQQKKQDLLLNIEHEVACSYYKQDSSIPINEYANCCDCYEKTIFKAGYFAAKGEAQCKK